MRLKQPTSECRHGNKFLAWNDRLIDTLRGSPPSHPSSSACQSGIESFSRGWDHAWTRPRFKRRRRTRVQICLPTVAYRRDNRGFSWVVTLFDAEMFNLFSLLSESRRERLKFAVIIISWWGVNFYSFLVFFLFSIAIYRLCAVNWAEIEGVGKDQKVGKEEGFNVFGWLENCNMKYLRSQIRKHDPLLIIDDPFFDSK